MPQQCRPCSPPGDPQGTPGDPMGDHRGTPMGWVGYPLVTPTDPRGEALGIPRETPWLLGFPWRAPGGVNAGLGGPGGLPGEALDSPNGQVTGSDGK